MHRGAGRPQQTTCATSAASLDTGASLVRALLLRPVLAAALQVLEVGLGTPHLLLAGMQVECILGRQAVAMPSTTEGLLPMPMPSKVASEVSTVPTMGAARFLSRPHLALSVLHRPVAEEVWAVSLREGSLVEGILQTPVATFLQVSTPSMRVQELHTPLAA
jgi:hypothetical protein